MMRYSIALVLAAVFSAAALPAQQPTASPATGQASPAPAAAQTPASAADQAADASVPVVKINANEVSLIFTVTDRHGHYIPNLQQSDFALLDDQKAPAKVNSFHQQINLPLRVGIVIDASTSIRSRFQFEQQSASEFLMQILKAKSDRAFVMGFDVTPSITQDWTNNVDALETGINRMRPGGGTALFDAVYTACRDKLLDTRDHGAGAQGDCAALRRRRQPEPRSPRTRRSRSASARRRSFTPSAPTGRRAAARAIRCLPRSPKLPEARCSFLLRSRTFPTAFNRLKKSCAASTH
jgi:hypothetical protein